METKGCAEARSWLSSLASYSLKSAWPKVQSIHPQVPQVGEACSTSLLFDVRVYSYMLLKHQLYECFIVLHTDILPNILGFFMTKSFEQCLPSGKLT